MLPLLFMGWVVTVTVLRVRQMDEFQVKLFFPGLAVGFIFITGDLASLQGVPEGLDHAAVLAKPFTASDLDALLTQLAPVRAR